VPLVSPFSVLDHGYGKRAMGNGRACSTVKLTPGSYFLLFGFGFF
jgi:hypothetical protein